MDFSCSIRSLICSKGLALHIEGFGLKERKIPISWYLGQVAVYWVVSVVNNKVIPNQSVLYFSHISAHAGLRISNCNAIAYDIQIGFADCISCAVGFIFEKAVRAFSVFDIKGKKSSLSLLIICYNRISLTCLYLCRYAPSEWLSVVMVTAGISVATLASAHTKHNVCHYGLTFREDNNCSHKSIK